MLKIQFYNKFVIFWKKVLYEYFKFKFKFYIYVSKFYYII